MAIYLGNTPIAENVTIQQGGGVTIDDTLSDTSENPVQNKVINAALNSKANTSDLSAHADNADIHVTTAEKATWNSKAELSDIPTTLPANGGNSDTSNSVKTTVLIGTAGKCAYSSILDWANNTPGNAWACVISAYGLPTDAPTQNEAIVSLECDTETIRKYVEWKVYDGGQSRVLKRCIFGTNWHGDWFNVADGGNAAAVNGRHSGRIPTQDASGNYWNENSTDINDAFIQWDGSTYFKLKTVGGNLTMVDNADTLDGKHASDFALKTDIPTTLPANGGNSNTTNHQINHYLGQNVDILTYATSDNCPQNVNTKVRIMNCPTCPTNYGYNAADNDFWYDIYKLDSNSWVTIKAYDVRGNVEFINSYCNGPWSGWVRCNDGGNAATANFATHSDYAGGSVQPTASNVCLRNLSSGTAAANTTNCPSGAWYGKHS